MHPRIDRFGAAQGLTGDTGLAVYSVGGRPVLVAKQGVFRLDERGQRLVPDTTWQGLSVGGTQDESAMAEDRQGNVWANFGLETAVFRRQTDGSYRVDKTALLRFSDMAVAKIYAEDDGVVWFGRDDGLVRFDPSVRQNYTTDYSALVRRVTLEDGRLLHGGATDRDRSARRAAPAARPTTRCGSSSRRPGSRARAKRITRRCSRASTRSGRRGRRNRGATTRTCRPVRTASVSARAICISTRARKRATRSSSSRRGTPPGGPTWRTRSACGAVVLGLVSLRTRKLRAESRRLERIVADRTQEIRERESEVRAQADELRRLDEIVKAINREEGLRNVLHALLEEGLKLVPQAREGHVPGARSRDAISSCSRRRWATTPSS